MTIRRAIPEIGSDPAPSPREPVVVNKKKTPVLKMSERGRASTLESLCRARFLDTLASLPSSLLDPLLDEYREMFWEQCLVSVQEAVMLPGMSTRDRRRVNDALHAAYLDHRRRVG